MVGGAGFIGSHLVERLLESGSVTVFDNLSVGKRSFLSGPLASGRCELVEGDARDRRVGERAAVGVHGFRVRNRCDERYARRHHRTPRSDYRKHHRPHPLSSNA